MIVSRTSRRRERAHALPAGARLACAAASRRGRLPAVGPSCSVEHLPARKNCTFYNDNIPMSCIELHAGPCTKGRAVRDVASLLLEIFNVGVVVRRPKESCSGPKALQQSYWARMVGEASLITVRVRNLVAFRTRRRLKWTWLYYWECAGDHCG